MKHKVKHVARLSHWFFANLERGREIRADLVRLSGARKPNGDPVGSCQKFYAVDPNKPSVHLGTYWMYFGAHSYQHSHGSLEV